MIGLDTNVLVRYVTQDDPVQSAKASNLIESLTVVSDAHIQQAVTNSKLHQNFACVGMPDNVMERFLDGQKQIVPHIRVQSHRRHIQWNFQAATDA